MKVSAWLVIEVVQPVNYSSRLVPKITKVRQTRPSNEMAVKVTLDIDPAHLQPHVEALVEAGHIALEIEEPEEVTA